MTMEEFARLQQTQMSIMDEVHRVCCENDIKYYIIGGTALGAKRHGGFIPWDIDIDIAMPREDYDKFAKLSKDILPSNLIYRDYKNTENFTHPHALVCIKDTYLEAKFDKFNPKLQNLGIYLDIFPLDTAPDSVEEQISHSGKITKLRKLKAYKLAFNHSADKKKKLVKGLISSLVFWTNIDKLNDDFDKLCRIYNGKCDTYLCSMSSHYSYKKQCMKKEIYGEPTLVDFSGRQYYAPQKIEEYLTIIYKDYMKLPPENERQANLDMIEKVVFNKE